MKHKFKLGMILIWSFFLLQCSGDEGVSGLTMSISPNQPLVIDSVATNSLGEEIQGPWFKFKYSLSNTSSSCLIIMVIKGEVFGPDGKSAKTFVVEPTEFLGTEYVAYLNYVDDKDVEQDCDTNNTADTLSPTLKFSDLKKYFFVDSITRNSAESFNYSVTIEAVGWYGTLDKQEARLTSVLNFTTQ
ncbi:MAG: hypothetical protein HOO06_06070 [Bdellovibrionaceae bacterium]|nr:hypothetical protein [Pseudobdellovibrionaceae bacterium]